MRVSQASLLDLLQCPRCATAVAESSHCRSCGLEFDTVGGQRVLIDYSRSVVERDAVVATGGSSQLGGRSSKRRTAPHTREVDENLRRVLGLVPVGGLVLVIGSGTDEHGLVDYYDSERVAVVGFDIYRSGLTDFVADAHAIPLKDASVDCVIVQAVLEHVVSPSDVVAEIWRVLAPSGVVYAETPFLQQVHEGAYDFTRFTESGHRWLFRKFAAIDSGPLGGPTLVLAWTFGYLLAAILPRWPRVGRVVRRLLTSAACVDLRMATSRRSDTASAVYFIGRKDLDYGGMSERDLIGFYRGAQA